MAGGPPPPRTPAWLQLRAAHLNVWEVVSEDDGNFDRYIQQCGISVFVLFKANSVLPVSVTPHTEQPGQSLQKEALYPGGHGVVGGRRAVVDVNHEDGDDDGEGDKDHDEEQVLSD